MQNTLFDSILPESFETRFEFKLQFALAALRWREHTEA